MTLSLPWRLCLLKLEGSAEAHEARPHALWRVTFRSARSRPSGMQDENNPVQQRCLAVLHGNAPCSDELRCAAERLLASGGELTRNRVTKTITSGAPKATTSKRAWTCESCTLANDGSSVTCGACGAHPNAKARVAEKAATWVCTRCTLENAATQRRCAACGEQRPKARAERAAPDDWSDDEDFALRKQQKASTM